MDSEQWRIWQILFVITALSVSNPLFHVAATNRDSDPYEYLNHSPSFDDSLDVPGEPMSPFDYQNAQGVVSDAPPKTDANGKYFDPIEFAGLYEGDIILKNGNSQNIHRNGIVNERQKWQNGQVPYIISSDFSEILRFNDTIKQIDSLVSDGGVTYAQQRGVIAKAMLEYQQRTCITFRPRTTENDYIHIHRGSGCSSLVGRAGGAQPVSIGTGCEYTGIVVHELMHAVGFWHEQSRYDRDDYVTVYFNNIQQGMEFNFQKHSWKDTQNLSVPYDLSSVMHYGPYAFSRYQGRPTILPRDPNKQIGQRSGFSGSDVEKINRLYKCSTGGLKPPTTTPLPTTKPPTSCQDFHRHCGYWAKRGECTKNPAWMKANCKSSCNECFKPCEDLNKNCYPWARRGECGRNPDYMLTYCRKSCNSCPAASVTETIPSSTTPASSSCQDKEKHCNYWANNGECSKNPKYMNAQCPKACKLC